MKLKNYATPKILLSILLKNKLYTKNIKLTVKDVRFILFILLILLITFTKSFAETKISTGSANWNTAGTWSPSGVPVAGDDVIIREQDQITVNTNAVCNTLIISTGNTTTTNISISTGFSLTVAGQITFGSVGLARSTKTLAVGTGTLTCGSLYFPMNVYLAVTRITISTGKVTVTGSIINNGGSNAENQIVFTGAGSLVIGGSWASSISTLTLANGCKVIYNGSSAQSVRAGAYRKLQLYGAGVKSILGAITIGGSSGDSLDIREGTAFSLDFRTITAGSTGIVFQIDGKLTTTNVAGLLGTTSTTLRSTNSPTINLGSNSTIEYASTSAQAITATNYANLTISGASTKTISAATTVNKELNVISGTLATGGFLTLPSTASNTARIGTATGTITGDVIVQRFIPGGSNKRKWRFLSSPVNITGSIKLSQYIDDIFVTAPAGSAAGFDNNPFGNNSSIRTYDESVSGASSNGWINPTNITNTISTALGTEVFVRGSRSLTDPFLLTTTPDDVTIDYIGALNTGTISPTITYTPSIGGASTSDGFNLVGNPYASSINFTHSGLTKTNIDNKFWCYNPNTGSYGIYDAGLGDSTNGITRFIASGQAFFIRANAASPAITFTEDIKCSATGNSYFKEIKTSQNALPILHIIVNNDSAFSDETLIVQDINANYFSGDVHDAGKLFNDALNVYTLSDDNVNMTINALPCSRTVDTISLAVFSYNGSNIMTTEHQFNFTGIENFPSTKKIYLLDQFTNTLTNLLYTTKYSFNITNDKASWGKNRFKLLFANSVLGVQSNSLNSNVELYPNPSNDYINLHFNAIESNTIQYYIYDISGRVIEYGIQELINNNSKISLTNLDQGNYIIKTINGNEVSVHRFTKN